LAGAEGLEPPTIGFGDRCSTNWNYAPATNFSYTTFVNFLMLWEVHKKWGSALYSCGVLTQVMSQKLGKKKHQRRQQLSTLSYN
tara:strand:- start:163 stop:414 length:252 start_codon:yes stop_codon:yes gene_type:complete